MLERKETYQLNTILLYICNQETDLYTGKWIPFRLRRRQFPIRLGFATTKNKAQGQSLSILYNWLENTIWYFESLL
ncbi:unnamed protein product [Haemonchus placei]|uniref:ATP-dependent DNA helicase n=1 Tax=Haemonchus placei TaxID=6290 RepID=A0A0N4W478_HAEPC|nr:unnamed protein product [Haemonchus placei]